MPYENGLKNLRTAFYNEPATAFLELCERLAIKLDIDELIIKNRMLEIF